jgi:hypothetical protein
MVVCRTKSLYGHMRHRVISVVAEAGLFDDAWRIRQSSVQLLGDLLYTVGGGGLVCRTKSCAPPLNPALGDSTERFGVGGSLTRTIVA